MFVADFLKNVCQFTTFDNFIWLHCMLSQRPWGFYFSKDGVIFAIQSGSILTL